MAGLDLRGIAAVVDSWLVDVVKATRDQGAADDTLDEETGHLVGPAETNVYEGRGMVQGITAEVEETDPDVAQIVDETGATYRLLLPPENGADLRVGDLVRVTEQNGTLVDPMLLERRFQVVHPGVVSSFHVIRIAYLKDITRTE